MKVSGLIAMQNDVGQFRMEKGQDSIRLYKVSKIDGEKLIQAVAYSPEIVYFKIVGKGLYIQFYFGSSESEYKPLSGFQDATIISSNKAGGFIGPFIGIYASSNGQKSSSKAYFDWFEYKSVH
jgi:xylan 1,4-beta-xylosidase